MNWIIFFVGSGAVFFLGIGLILLGLGIFSYFQSERRKPFGSLLMIMGLLLAALSATPLPYWLYFVAGIATLASCAAERQSRGWLFARRRVFRWSAIAAWASAIAWEMPYVWCGTLVANGNPTFYIIGDSVTAGIGGEKETWPRILARSQPVKVVDLAMAGATVKSALKQADGLPADGGLLLLEIGGNDLLGTTSAVDFERGLAKLLERVCVPSRTVLMFELPLPPFCNEYGRIQRQLAAQYNVLLVPKRVFATVLTGAEATLDSVHLDRRGHERMAKVVWNLIQPAYGK